MAATHIEHERTLAFEPGRFEVSALLRTYPAVIAVCALAIFMLTRVVLTLLSVGEIALVDIPHIFLLGFWFDIVTIGTMLSPFLLANALLPDVVRRSRAFAWFSIAVIWLLLVTLLFSALGEYFFWDEFSTRYNFIAVDYLVYTQEVLANIVQSYPVKTLTAGIAGVAALLLFGMRGWIRTIGRVRYSGATRLAMLALAVVGPMLSAVAHIDQMRGSGNAYADELSGNGLFSLVTAFFLNELDYDRFYATLPEAKALSILNGLGVPRVRTASTNEPSQAEPPLPSYLLSRPKNIVLLTVESLSAEFVGAYGNTRGLTPNIDRVAKTGLVFDSLFATGTRTVRGLEATSLGTPPVPGQAIVRRHGSNHLTTIGELLHAKGFDVTFAYGGNAFFDNMAAFFGGNDYAVLDESDFPASTIAFENAWGVADEGLFDNVERRISSQVATDGKPFFVHVMTTSNHRPYTYPDGRIDIASPGGRDGAVKYTDYAIGRFLAQARTQPWFKDTLFVITADHCASAAGNTELPVSGYHIPMVFYGPGIVRPGHVAGMVSQADLPPTFLRLLGLPGEQFFFGRAIDGDAQGDERAFISTYQSLGYLKEGILTVLRPKKVVESYRVDPRTLASTPIPVDPKLRDEAIAYYQTASHDFASGALRAPR